MTRAGARGRALRRVGAVLAAWAFGGGCVYYNGIYNAQTATKAGEARLRADDESEASNQFRLAAERAESVLARFPKSTWRTRALYLAGRGAAYASQCDQAVPRLTEFLAASGTSDGDRQRARLALGVCDVRSQRMRVAMSRLDSLVDAPDRAVSRQARLWAARAALGVGDRDAAQAYASTLDASALQWELLTLSLSAGEFVRAESVLVGRAMRGDYRDDATRAVRELFTAGRIESAERILAGYDAARIGNTSRASMHYALGDMYLRNEADSLARGHLSVALTLAGRDSVTAREAAARLALLGVRRLATVNDLDSVLAREDSAVRRTAYARRTAEHLLLLRMLERVDDPTGASIFLAAEVARDSLRAPRMARGLFMRVARDVAGSPLAASAFYAASLLEPDSAESWRGEIQRAHGNSSVAARLRGEDPAMRPDFVTAPELLRGAWTLTTRRWADSVSRLRAARTGPGAPGAAPPRAVPPRAVPPRAVPPRTP